MILLTIIIPHYNNPDLLNKLLESIPQNDEIEIIVVDDKSNKYLDKYYELTVMEKFNHVVFVNNTTEEKGAGAARNIGIDKAKGDWLLFADADDYFVPGFYSILSNYLSSNYDVVFFKLTSVYLDTGQVAERHAHYNKIIDNYLAKNEMKTVLTLRYLNNHPYGKMISREFIVRYNIKFDAVIASNDVMFSARVGYHMNHFYVTDQIIYCVTRGKGSLTMSIDEAIYDIRLQVFIMFYKYLQENLSQEEFKLLHLNGLGKIVDVFKYRLGFTKMIHVIFELKKNNIKILDIHQLNPLVAIKKTKLHMKRFKSERKYMGKSK